MARHSAKYPCSDFATKLKPVKTASPVNVVFLSHARDQGEGRSVQIVLHPTGLLTCHANKDKLKKNCRVSYLAGRSLLLWVK
jgi:hypothetical protein